MRIPHLTSHIPHLTSHISHLTSHISHLTSHISDRKIIFVLRSPISCNGTSPLLRAFFLLDQKESTKEKIKPDEKLRGKATLQRRRIRNLLIPFFATAIVEPTYPRRIRQPPPLLFRAIFRRAWKSCRTSSIFPNSQLPTPNSQLPTPNSQLPTPNFFAFLAREKYFRGWQC